MAPWTEYSTVKTTSSGRSVNWPRKAKFSARSGRTLGRSAGTRRLAGEGPERAVVFGGEAGLGLRAGRDRGQHPLAGGVEAGPPRAAERVGRSGLGQVRPVLFHG